LTLAEKQQADMIRGDVEKLCEHHLMGLKFPLSWKLGNNIKVWWPF
jgi:hypothetical protein